MSDTMLNLCIKQGYVKPGCKLDGMLVWLLIQDGKNPCEGCNADCVHKISDDDWTLWGRPLVEENRPRFDLCSMVYVEHDYRDINITVIDGINHKGYFRRCRRGIDEAIFVIREMCSKYNTNVVLVPINGPDASIYHRLKEFDNLDVVPIRFGIERK